jgi:hypothetical protein
MAGSVILQFGESLSMGRVIALLIAFLFGAFLVDFTWKPQYPRSLPQVGYGDGVLGTMRNWLGYVLYFNEWVAEGYGKVRRYPRAQCAARMGWKRLMFGVTVFQAEPYLCGSLRCQPTARDYRPAIADHVDARDAGPGLVHARCP